MKFVQHLSALALRGTAHFAAEAVGLRTAGDAVEGVVGFLAGRFRDHSQRLTRALRLANERAWRALEIALAGESWWGRCKAVLESADQKALRHQVQAFLDAAPLPPGNGDDFRQECLCQLRAARKAGMLGAGSLDTEQLARRVGAFARFADPARVLDAEWLAVDDMAGAAREYGYDSLAKLLALRPPQGPPLLVVAARYFFRREVESDRELFQGLAFARLEQLTQSQQAGFDSLQEALARHGDRLEELLGDVRAVVVETHADVLDIKSELLRQGQQIQELGGAVLAALEQHRLERRELSPADSLSIRGDAERQLVRSLVARYRALPADERRRLPALLNAVGKLEVVAGEFEAAQRDFQEVVALVPDPAPRAEAHHNAYRAALERRAWPEALVSLCQAAAGDAERFAPFPLAKFEPERILGAGGFGVAFLCRNRHSGSRVVLKTLRGDGLDRDLTEVFREAQVLEELDHPAIIRVRDCDYAGAGRSRPYLVMDYFPGQNLAEYVEQHGPLAPADLVALARQAASGLQAAHGKGILHRDVKPANLLVHRAQGEPGASATGGWQVKLIDFGLALRTAALQSTARSRGDRTLAGSSIAGTLDYAAPEQMGRLQCVPVTPRSDVYGFGKTCCFALFRTPQPTWQHWQKLQPPLAELLGRCLSESPADRPADFAAVVDGLSRLAVREEAPIELILEADVPEAIPLARPTARAPVPPKTVREPRRRRVEDEEDEYEPRRRPRRGLSLGAGCVIVGVLGMATCIGLPFAMMGAFKWMWPGGASRPALPAQNPPPKPAKPLADREIAKALKTLKAPDAKGRAELAERFAATPYNAKDKKHRDNRKDVAAALEGLLDKGDKNGKLAAAKALGVWGTDESGPALVELFKDHDGDIRAAALDALAKRKYEPAAAAVAKRLEDPWDRDRAAAALVAFGPGVRVERAVWPYVNKPDFFTAQEALKVLEAVGTPASLDVLRAKAKDNNPSVKQAAEAAIRAIEEREK